MTGPELLVLLAAVGLGGWVVDVAVHPYAPCFACKGRRGRGVGSRAKAWGRCRVCGGNGERLRLGARWIRRDLRK